MEVSVVNVAVSVVIVSIVTWAWSVLNWVWLRPKKLETCLRQQGLTGNSYRLLFGDSKESSMMLQQAESKPINLSTTHDIAQRVFPFLHQTVNTYVSVALSVATVSILTWAWRVLNWVWLRPKKLEACLRKQGLRGNSYHFFFGDSKESSMMLQQAKSKPINLSTTHDIAPRVFPFLHQTVNTYGKNSFYWMGPIPCVIIMNPEELKDILNKYEDFQKPHVSNPLLELVLFGVVGYEGEKWAKHRKIMNPAFHLEKLKCMIPEFYETCGEMINEWESLVSKEGSYELDVWPHFLQLARDVISRTAFGSSYKEGRTIFQLLTERIQLGLKVLQSVYIPGSRFLPTKQNKRMKEIDKEIKGIVMGIINKREEAMKAGEATKDDLLGILLESNFKENQNGNNKKVGMSIEDVIKECQLFYLAGQETLAALLVWTMVLLSQNPKWQVRARDEVLQVFGSNKPDYDGLSHLKVINMILLEVLRLYPAGNVFNRATHKKTQIGKLTLPAGVEVALSNLLVHHDRELWGEDAEEFKPERFSEGVSKATKGQLLFLPFGGGPRICIGQNFAMLEAKMVFSLILQHFTFELSPSYAHAPASIVGIYPQFGAHIILHKR